MTETSYVQCQNAADLNVAYRWENSNKHRWISNYYAHFFQGTGLSSFTHLCVQLGLKQRPLHFFTLFTSDTLEGNVIASIYFKFLKCILRKYMLEDTSLVQNMPKSKYKMDRLPMSVKIRDINILPFKILFCGYISST